MPSPTTPHLRRVELDLPWDLYEQLERVYTALQERRGPLADGVVTFRAMLVGMLRQGVRRAQEPAPLVREEGFRCP